MSRARKVDGTVWVRCAKLSQLICRLLFQPYHFVKELNGHRYDMRWKLMRPLWSRPLTKVTAARHIRSHPVMECMSSLVVQMVEKSKRDCV